MTGLEVMTLFPLFHSLYCVLLIVPCFISLLGKNSFIRHHVIDFYSFVFVDQSIDEIVQYAEISIDFELSEKNRFYEGYHYDGNFFSK